MIEGHGDDLYKYEGKIKINFSSNVYNRLDHTILFSHLCDKMGMVTSYPEPQPTTLERKLAEVWSRVPMDKDGIVSSVSSDAVCVTNGATEAIYLLAQTYAGAESVIIEPTFSEYTDACLIYNHCIERVSSLEECHQFCQKDKQKPCLAWLCNPNNPTGKVYDKSELLKLIQANRDVLFVIDQSYEFFTLKEVITIEEGIALGNVVLLHSMTKRYAIPGIRLGYMTAEKSLIEAVRVRRMPWSVNAFAQSTGLFLLEHDLSSSTHIPQLLNEASKLADGIKNMGGISGPYFRVMPTDTHYMLVQIVKDLHYKNGVKSAQAIHLKEHLAQVEGILIRDASNFFSLDASWFRIAAQSESENQLLLAALSKLCM